MMSASEAANGLMFFQPPDVLNHIGARHGQWLTVVIMEGGCGRRYPSWGWGLRVGRWGSGTCAVWFGVTAWSECSHQSL